MALTQGSWVKSTSNGYHKWECTVAHTNSENDAYTLKTPKELDGSKQWAMSMSASATADGAALPLDLWAGFNDDFALSGNDAAVTAGTNGFEVKQICDDCVLAVSTLKYNFIFDPELPVADVTTVAAIANGFKVRTPIAPYYAFNLDGGGTLNNSITTTWTIFQEIHGENVGMSGTDIGGDGTTGIGPDPS
jgi:hypothetical protein